MLTTPPPGDAEIVNQSVERPGYTTGELAKIVGTSSEVVRKKILAGHIRAVRVGRLHLVPVEEARRLYTGVAALM